MESTQGFRDWWEQLPSSPVKECDHMHTKKKGLPQINDDTKASFLLQGKAFVRKIGEVGNPFLLPHAPWDIPLQKSSGRSSVQVRQALLC